MVSPEELAGPDRAGQLFGAEVVDIDGDRVGTVNEVFLDDDTDQPTWVSVRTGWFGTNESLVPLRDADISGDRIRVHHDKATIKAAPRSDDGQPLSRDDEGALYRHYHRELGRGHAVADDSVVNATDDRVVNSTDDRPRDDRNGADGSMVRSEEQLAAGTERVATGRARLRKYLVTEEQQITVSVSREDVRVEYVTDVHPAATAVGERNVSAAAATAGRSDGDADKDPDDVSRGGSNGRSRGVSDGIPGGTVRDDDRTLGRDARSGGDRWMVLYAQRPVVTMEWVPVERVRLGTVEVTAEETVTGEVRQERLDVVTDDLADREADRGRHGVTGSSVTEEAAPERAVR
jgi:stress response protein YsnF/sporulation protein YlmC with PRC-barrel domain